MADMRMLECQGLRRSFGDLVAVDGVGFHIDAGETYGLPGPNGAGKTTTISMIAGLLERDGGEVGVAGEPMTTHAIRTKAAIGYVPQDLAIYPDLSARENLVFFARLYGMPTAEAKRRSREVLEVTGLADRAGDQAKKSSRGMKRRLNIGIGLLHRPKLLIVDEPPVWGGPGRAATRSWRTPGACPAREWRCCTPPITSTMKMPGEAMEDGPAGREDDMQIVTLGAAELQVAPMAWQARAGGSRAL